MEERSGLSITSLTGRLFSNDSIIRIPELKLQTPHSEIDLSAQTYWELVNIPTTGRLSASFNAHIGKEDVMLFAGGLPQTFKEAYPFRPLVIRAGTDGNLKEMQISRFTVDLPGAFSLKGGGILENLTDSLTRSGTIGLDMVTRNLNFLTGLTGVTPDGSLVIPDSIDVYKRQKQRCLNQPYGDVGHLLRPLAYRAHTYQWPTIGKDLSHRANRCV